jgi:hypothetical protein
MLSILSAAENFSEHICYKLIYIATLRLLVMSRFSTNISISIFKVKILHKVKKLLEFQGHSQHA